MVFHPPSGIPMAMVPLQGNNVPRSGTLCPVSTMRLLSGARAGIRLTSRMWTACAVRSTLYPEKRLCTSVPL